MNLYTSRKNNPNKKAHTHRYQADEVVYLAKYIPIEFIDP